MENPQSLTSIKTRPSTPVKKTYSNMAKSTIGNINSMDRFQKIQTMQIMQRIPKTPCKNNKRNSHSMEHYNINNSRLISNNHLNVTSNAKSNHKNHGQLELRLETLEQHYLKLLHHVQKKASLQNNYQLELQKLRQRREKDQKQLDRLYTMAKYLSSKNISIQTINQCSQKQTSSCHTKCQKSTNPDHSIIDNNNWKKENKNFQNQNIVPPVKKSRIDQNKMKSSSIMGKRKSPYNKLKFVPSVII